MKSINSAGLRNFRAGGISIASLIGAAAIVAMSAGCGGGGGGGGGTTTPPSTNTVLSGKFTYSGSPQAQGYVVSVEGATPANSTLTDASSNYSLTVKSGTAITIDVSNSSTTFYTQAVTVGTSATQTVNLAMPGSSAPPPPPL